MGSVCAHPACFHYLIQSLLNKHPRARRIFYDVEDRNEVSEFYAYYQEWLLEKEIIFVTRVDLYRRLIDYLRTANRWWDRITPIGHLLSTGADNEDEVSTSKPWTVSQPNRPVKVSELYRITKIAESVERNIASVADWRDTHTPYWSYLCKDVLDIVTQLAPSPWALYLSEQITRVDLMKLTHMSMINFAEKEQALCQAVFAVTMGHTTADKITHRPWLTDERKKKTRAGRRRKPRRHAVRPGHARDDSGHAQRGNEAPAS